MVTEKDTLNFTKGACWILAEEISAVTGWDIVAFYSKTPNYMAKHVFVRTPDEKFLDIEGKHSAGEMFERWECKSGYYISKIRPGDRRRCSLPHSMGDQELYRERARELVPELVKKGYMKRQHLVRDKNGEPVRELRNRDGRGRFCRPYYAYLWE